MANAPVRDVLGPSEAALASASEVIRRWDVATVLGALVFFAVASLSVFGLWSIATPTLTRWQSLHLSGDLVVSMATLGKRGAEAWPALLAHPWVGVRSLVAFLLAVASSWLVFQAAARPMSRVRHIEGDQLLEGKEAERAAKAQSDPKPWVKLHPLLGISKEQATYHTLIVGGTGSGKSVILARLIKQIAIEKNKKCLIYDVKGDWTAALPRALLISPWDRRSARWSISADVQTPQAAETLAQSLIPSSKEGDFWTPAARAIVVGVLIMLIYKRQHEGKHWSWRTLADTLQADAYELHDIMAAYYPAGLRLLADPSSTTALNVLQTISAHTRVIEQLAVAWDDEGQREDFSITAWAMDNYKGRHRQVILQAGPDRDLTARYISAMINTLIPVVISPSMKDDWMRRTLALFLDEFTSIGKVDWGPLLDKSRSKGGVIYLAFQSIDQVKELYSPNFANSMQSMVGTTIVCRVGMGETQNFMAGLFNKRRVAVTSFSQSPGSLAPSISQHEETRPVVMPSQLGALGAVKKRKGFAIRAIVKMTGKGDPLLLEFPGEPLPSLRPSFVPAEWTKGVSKKAKRNVEPVESRGSKLNLGQPEPEQDQQQEQLSEIQDAYVDPLDRVLGRSNGASRDL